MKRIALKGSIVLTSMLILVACLPTTPNAIRDTPTRFVGSTPSAGITITPTSTSSFELSSTATLFPTRQFTAIPSFTPTIDQFVEIPLTGTAPSTSETAIPITETAPSVDSFASDKLSSDTIYKSIHILNNSGKPVDVILECTTKKGQQTILEYKNVKNLFVDIPAGNYTYVIFVGGRKQVGNFSFLTSPKLFMTILKDRIAIH